MWKIISILVISVIINGGCKNQSNRKNTDQEQSTSEQTSNISVKDETQRKLDEIYLKFLECCKMKGQSGEQINCFTECEKAVGELIKTANTFEERQTILDNWNKLKGGR